MIENQTQPPHLTRHPKLQIDINTINKFFTCSNSYPGKPATLQEIGPVWETVLSDWTLSSVDIFTAIENKDFESLIKIYENYYIQGVSEGASTGKAFESKDIGGVGENYKHQKNIRNINRIKQLGVFLGIESENLYDIIHSINDRISIPNSINQGQTWGWWFGDIFVHFELSDYIYFLDSISTVLKDLNLTKTIFLGDGSGLLSTLVYNNCNINSSYHIDLGHFLFKQFLNNPDRNDIQYYYAEGFNPSTPMEAEILINQDSFPEMSDESVKKYIKNIKLNEIPYVLSYNKSVTFEGGCIHSDWKSELLKQGYTLISSLSPTMREGYVIEVFELKNNG